MWELMRKPRTDGGVEISIRAPEKEANQVFEATKHFLLLSGRPIREVNDHGEPLFTLEDVFPDLHPGNAIRGYRARESMTQKELAAKLSISPRHLSDMEHGRRPIGKAMAKRLEQATGIGWKVFL